MLSSKRFLGASKYTITKNPCAFFFISHVFLFFLLEEELHVEVLDILDVLLDVFEELFSFFQARAALLRRDPIQAVAWDIRSLSPTCRVSGRVAMHSSKFLNPIGTRSLAPTEQSQAVPLFPRLQRWHRWKHPIGTRSLSPTSTSQSRHF